MARQLHGIDHAVVAVRDLEGARADYRRLGFRTTPLGLHAGVGTANHCVMLDDDYLELVGVHEPGDGSAELERFLAEREGMVAIALKSGDPEATREAWHDAGLEPGAVGDFVRVLEPDQRLRFHNVMLAKEQTGGVPMFACAPLDRERMREDEWLGHPNGARRIESLTIVVEEPAAYEEPMGRVFGRACLTDTDDTLAVHTGHGVLLFVTPDDLLTLHPELDAIVTQRRPIIAALTLLVDDVGATAAWLDQRDVPYRRDAGGALGISPRHARGVRLEFTAAPAATRWL
jgi:catechol 2,3-dioxygenase-like lactoylglutathione lyase family enzyme